MFTIKMVVKGKLAGPRRSYLHRDPCNCYTGPLPGFNVWKGKIHFRGKGYCFYYMFKRKFSSHNKIWRCTKNWGYCPPGP